VMQIRPFFAVKRICMEIVKAPEQGWLWTFLPKGRLNKVTNGVFVTLIFDAANTDASRSTLCAGEER